MGKRKQKNSSTGGGPRVSETKIKPRITFGACGCDGARIAGTARASTRTCEHWHRHLPTCEARWPFSLHVLPCDQRRIGATGGLEKTVAQATWLPVVDLRRRRIRTMTCIAAPQGRRNPGITTGAHSSLGNGACWITHWSCFLWAGESALAVAANDVFQGHTIINTNKNIMSAKHARRLKVHFKQE